MAAGYSGLPSDPHLADAQEAKPAQDAVDVKIEGVEKSYAVGDLIEIDAVVTGLGGDAKVKYDWKVTPEVKFKVWPDGSKVLLGTGPKPTNYTIYLAVAALTNGAEPTQILETRIDTATVTQEGEQVDQPAPDKPELIDPKPVIGQFGTTAKELAKKVTITEFYTKAEFDEDAKLLAQNFDLIASQAESGQIDSLKLALEKTREFNRNFGNSAIWANWFSGVSEMLVKENEQGGLKTSSDVAKVWKDIATGLQNL